MHYRSPCPNPPPGEYVDNVELPEVAGGPKIRIMLVNL
jgi:hypothetical protein